MTSNFNPMVCREGKDLARCLIFIIETKRVADPDLAIADIYELMLCSMRYGNVICFRNEHGQVVGIVCYTIGTLEAEFEDPHIAHVDYCLMEPSLQGTFYFLKCLHYLVQTIMNEHVGVELFSLKAYENIKRNNRLYAKFAQRTGQIQGGKGGMNVYTTTLEQLQVYLQRMIGRRMNKKLLNSG